MIRLIRVRQIVTKKERWYRALIPEEDDRELYIIVEQDSHFSKKIGDEAWKVIPKNKINVVHALVDKNQIEQIDSITINNRTYITVHDFHMLIQRLVDKVKNNI